MNNKIYQIHIMAVLCGLVCSVLLSSCVKPPQPEIAPLSIQVAELDLASGVTSFHQGDYHSAVVQFNDALAIYRSIDHVSGKTKTHMNLAETYMAVGNLHKAKSHLQSAKSLAEKEGLTNLLPSLNLMDSSLAIREKRYSKAIKVLTPYLPNGDIQTNSFGLAALQNRVIIALKTEPSSAEKWIRMYDRAMQGGAKQPLQNGRLLRFQAFLAQQAGDFAKRDALFEKALNIYREATARPGIAATLTEWARDTISSGQLDKADDLLQRAIAVRIGMQDIVGCIEVMELMQEYNKKTANQGQAKQVSKWLAILKRIKTAQLPAILPYDFPVEKIVGTL